MSQIWVPWDAHNRHTWQFSKNSKFDQNRTVWRCGQKNVPHVCTSKNILVSHPYIPHVSQNQFWLVGNRFRPSSDTSKFKNAQKTTLKKIFIYDSRIKAGIYAEIGPSQILIQNSPKTKNIQRMIITSNDNMIIYFGLRQKKFWCAHIRHIFVDLKKITIFAKNRLFPPAK